MTVVALFPSVLGVRPGVLAAVDLLRSHGHEVHVIDPCDGQVFDDYEPAMAYSEEVGFPALMQLALDATAGLPDGLVTMGYSNGGGMAEHVACQRPGVRGVVLLAGALDPAWLKAEWPAGLPAQIHTTQHDPWREQEAIDAVAAAVTRAGGEVEVFDYPGAGHLFSDPSKADEYQPEEAALMWRRVVAFLDRVDASVAGSP